MNRSVTGAWCITECIYRLLQSVVFQSHLSAWARANTERKKELHRKTNILLSRVPFGGSCGSCRPLRLFTGVPVGLVWTDPPRGFALVHKTQSPLLLLFCARTLFPECKALPWTLTALARKSKQSIIIGHWTKRQNEISRLLYEASANENPVENDTL